jgi:hypothetical protein
MTSRSKAKAGLILAFSVLWAVHWAAYAVDPVTGIGKTRVLLLPPLDATVDSAHMQGPRQFVIRPLEKKGFQTRRFQVVDEALAAKAANASPPIDLNSLSARTAGNLDRLAKRAAADWVVNIVVKDAAADHSSGGAFTARTRILLQVWDARLHGWLANGSYDGQNSGDSPVRSFKRSLEDAVQTALTGFLDAHPGKYQGN